MKLTLQEVAPSLSEVCQEEIRLEGVPGGLYLEIDTHEGPEYIYISRARWAELVEAGNLILGEGA